MYFDCTMDHFYISYALVKGSLMHLYNPLPDNKIFDWFKLKQIADAILKYI